MVDIAVLYADLEVDRVSWADKANLKRDEVLAISVVSTEHHKRLLSKIGHDYYQLVWTDDDVCLTGHDDDYMFCSLTGPGFGWRFPFMLPDSSIEFEGVTVHSDQFEKAKLIYGDPKGPMY